MKIAIYGDSFATGFHVNKHFAWYNILAKKLGGTVFNEQGEEGYGIAWGGRATYLSYKNFLKYYKNYDFNIFIAGDPYRHTKEYIWEDRLYYVSNINSIEWALERKIINDVDADMLKGWFLSSDINFLKDAQDLFLRDIKNKDSKCLIIPAQQEYSFTKEFMDKSNMNFGLSQLHGVMLKSMKCPSGFWANKEPPNKIACHFTEEVNEWLANSVYEYITNNKKLELPEHIHHTYDYRYYFEEK